MTYKPVRRTGKQHVDKAVLINSTSRMVFVTTSDIIMLLNVRQF
jgi:hypothetical protein